MALMRPRLALRTLLFALTVVCAVLSYFAPLMERVRRTERALAALPGVCAGYDYETRLSAAEGPDPPKTPPGPAILRWILGESAFADVVRLSYFEYFDEEHALNSDALRHLEEFGALRELELGQMRERLNDAALARLSPLAQVSALDLSGAPVTDAGLRHLAALVNLESLNLDRTEVTGEGFAQLVRCKKLTHLYLRHVRLSVAGILAIEQFTGLRSLTFVPPPGGDEEAFRVCGRLPRLCVLELDGARLSGGCLRHIANLEDLQYLIIHGGSVAAGELSQLPQLPRLQMLSLSGTELTDAGAAELGGLTHLDDLFLDNTAITDDALPHLAGLTRLRRLGLSGTAITRQGLLHLRNLEHLEFIDLSGTEMWNLSAAELSRLLPNCHGQQRAERTHEAFGRSAKLID